MTINVELLDRTLAHIEANPERWDQAVYRCATGMCFAGWACTLAGGLWISDDDEVLVAEPGEWPTHQWDGEVVATARVRATRILGLDDAQASDLFSADNTIEDLRRIVAELREVDR